MFTLLMKDLYSSNKDFHSASIGPVERDGRPRAGILRGRGTSMDSTLLDNDGDGVLSGPS